MVENSNHTQDDQLPEYVHITDVLDLHGTSPKIIPEMIADFIGNAIELGYNRVRIIHGKGRSKLKHLTYKQLQKNEHVIDFYDAPPETGGWGATIVELKD